MAKALDRLRGAKRPVIIVGHGARFHMPEVTALAEQLGAPVITTFKAKGQIGDDHPLAAGVLGRSGTPVASWVMNEADLLRRDLGSVDTDDQAAQLAERWAIWRAEKQSRVADDRGHGVGSAAVFA